MMMFSIISLKGNLGVSNSSTMISQSIIDKVDMTQFYGKSQGALRFNCTIDLESDSITGKVVSFKKCDREITVLMTCDQTYIIPLICQPLDMTLRLSADDIELLFLEDISSSNVSIDINYLQDLNCQVKLIIQN